MNDKNEQATSPAHATKGGVEAADAVWLLRCFADLFSKSCDPQSVVHECAGRMDLAELEHIAARLDLQVTNLPLHPTPWLKKLPVAVQMKMFPSDDSSHPPHWFILLAVDGSDVLALTRAGAKPIKIPVAALSQGPVCAISIRSRAAKAAGADLDSASERRFGFSWFVPELLKHKRIWRDVLVASLVLQLISLAFPLFTQAVIDKVVIHRTQSTLIALATGMAVFIVFTAVLSWVRQYLVLHTGNRVDAVLGSRVFEQLFRLPPLYFQHRPTGIISARLQGIETIREFVSSAAITLLLDLPFLLIFVAVMFWYSVQLTLVVLALIGLIVACSLLVAPLFRKRLNEQFQRGAANQAFVTEYIAGLETVKSLQLEAQVNRQYRDLLAEFLQCSFRARQLGNTYSTLANGLEQVMTLLILVLGAYIVMTSSSFTIGMLVAFQMFSSRLSQPMLRLVGLWQQFQQARIAVTRLGDIMNAPVEPYSLTQARSKEGRGAIEIDELAFRYGDNLPLLYEGFSLRAAPGQLIAIMGPSGAGKSTLAKLLQGFYQPTSGSIRIDDLDIRHMSANELRGHFGVVPQETTLFSGTILDNLKLANPHATFEQVVAACRMAEIHTVIESLPNGYQTHIGERGAGLSGGQRQRIAIARALLKGPKILVFDEATSSVDGPTAEQLGRTITALKGRATILFIAHALPKSLQVDRLVRLGENKVANLHSDRRIDGQEAAIGGAGAATI